MISSPSGSPSSGGGGSSRRRAGTPFTDWCLSVEISRRRRFFSHVPAFPSVPLDTQSLGILCVQNWEGSLDGET